MKKATTPVRKRDNEGLTVKKKRETQTPSRTNRAASQFRGVTHHCRTNRFEAHIWQDSKQIYLGGFYSEQQAALAYDLAAIRFRYDDAITNFNTDLYQAELADTEAGCPSHWDVVQSLRGQSKVMNRVDPAAGDAQGIGVCMMDWEIAISAAVHCDRTHLGVFSSDTDAARAYDRILVMQRGLDASTGINFNLVDYADLLTKEQIQDGIDRGLLPSTLPLSYKPVPAPQPVLHIGATINNNPTILIIPMLTGLPIDGAHDDDDEQEEEAAKVVGVIPKKASITPRSVLDFEEMVACEEVARHRVNIDAVGMQLTRENNKTANANAIAISKNGDADNDGPWRTKTRKSSNQVSETSLETWLDNVVV